MTNICHLTSIVDLANQGQTLSNDLHYLWLNTCCRLDFSFDFNIIEVEELKISKINNVSIMTDLEKNINLKKSGLTLKIKVKHQGQVTGNRFSEILDLKYVKFDTKIE